METTATETLTRVTLVGGASPEGRARHAGTLSAGARPLIELDASLVAHLDEALTKIALRERENGLLRVSPTVVLHEVDTLTAAEAWALAGVVANPDRYGIGADSTFILTASGPLAPELDELVSRRELARPLLSDLSEVGKAVAIDDVARPQLHLG